MTDKNCPFCQGLGWVCENHPTRPWEGEHACTYGGAGAPCPMCNSSEHGETPRMPDGFKTRSTKTAGAIELVDALSDPIELPNGPARPAPLAGRRRAFDAGFGRHREEPDLSSWSV